MEVVVAIRHATIVGIFTVMLMMVLGSGCAEDVIDDSKNTGYLFVISGTSGSLDGDTLTLNGVPNVIYFTDRQGRGAGHMTLKEFVGKWNKGKDSFKADPPNATLSVLKKDGAKNVVVVLISVEQKSGSVVFKVAVSESESSLGDFTAGSVFLDTVRLPFIIDFPFPGLIIK